MYLSLREYVLSIVISYIPFHLFKEGSVNFPLWMKEQRYMYKKASYGFCMAGSRFFYCPLCHEQ